MPTKKSGKKPATTKTGTKSSSQGTRKKSAQKRASGPVRKVTKAVSRVVTGAGEAMADVAKAVLPLKRSEKRSK